MGLKNRSVRLTVVPHTLSPIHIRHSNHNITELANANEKVTHTHTHTHMYIYKTRYLQWLCSHFKVFSLRLYFKSTVLRTFP